jgi:hypothetical protein
MKVQVPEGMDMGGLEASDLTLFAAAGGDHLTGAGLSRLSPSVPAVLLHAPQKTFVAGQWA